jgi:hypothetical protein
VRERCWQQDLARKENDPHAVGPWKQHCLYKVGQSGLLFLGWTRSRSGGEQKPFLSCGCHGTEGTIIRTGWDLLNPSWEETGTTLPYLPALTSFEDGTEKALGGNGPPCDSYTYH